MGSSPMTYFRKSRSRLLHMKPSKLPNLFHRRLAASNICSFFRLSFGPLLLHIVSCCAFLLIGHRIAYEGVLVFGGSTSSAEFIATGVHSLKASAMPDAIPKHELKEPDTYSRVVIEHLRYLEDTRVVNGSWSAGSAAGGGINGTRHSRARRHGILIRTNPHPDQKEVILAQELLLTLQEHQRLRGVSDSQRALLVVTPTIKRSFQALHFQGLINSLRLATVPLLWIVVEAGKQTNETASLLKGSGISYVHLHHPVRFRINHWDSRMQAEARLREKGLKYIRNNWIRGLVVFADDSTVFSRQFFDEVQGVKWFGAGSVSMLLQAGFEQQYDFDSYHSNSKLNLNSKSISFGNVIKLSNSMQSTPNLTSSNLTLRRLLISRPYAGKSSFDNIELPASFSPSLSSSSPPPLPPNSLVLNLSESPASAFLKSTQTKISDKSEQHSIAVGRVLLQSSQSSQSSQSFVSVQSPVCSENGTLIGWHTTPHTPLEVSQGISGHDPDKINSSVELARMSWTGFVFDSRLIWKSFRPSFGPHLSWFHSKSVAHSRMDNVDVDDYDHSGDIRERPVWVRDWNDWVEEGNEDDEKYTDLAAQKDEVAERRIENQGLIGRMVTDERMIETIGECGLKVMVWWSRIDARYDSKHPPGWVIDPKLPIVVPSKNTPWKFPKNSNFSTSDSNSTSEIKSKSTSKQSSPLTSNLNTNGDAQTASATSTSENKSKSTSKSKRRKMKVVGNAGKMNENPKIKSDDELDIYEVDLNGLLDVTKVNKQQQDRNHHNQKHNNDINRVNDRFINDDHHDKRHHDRNDVHNVNRGHYQDSQYVENINE